MADIPQRFVKTRRPFSGERNHLSISAQARGRRRSGSFRHKSVAKIRTERPGEQKRQSLCERRQVGSPPLTPPHLPRHLCNAPSPPPLYVAAVEPLKACTEGRQGAVLPTAPTLTLYMHATTLFHCVQCVTTYNDMSALRVHDTTHFSYSNLITKQIPCSLFMYARTTEICNSLDESLPKSYIRTTIR